jgi:hypothetical protein
MQALAHHENAAATLRAALALVSEAPRAKYVRKGTTNGHTNGNGHLPAMFQEAIAIDATRRGEKPKRKVTGAHKEKMRQQRAATAAFLASFDLTRPRPKAEIDEPKRIGVLVQRGYLKLKGAGYVRTGKVFVVNAEGAK